MDAGVKTPQCPHLSIVTSVYQVYYQYANQVDWSYFNQLDSLTDLSPIPVRSAATSYV